MFYQSSFHYHFFYMNILLLSFRVLTPELRLLEISVPRVDILVRRRRRRLGLVFATLVLQPHWLDLYSSVSLSLDTFLLSRSVITLMGTAQMNSSTRSSLRNHRKCKSEDGEEKEFHGEEEKIK